MTQRIVERVDNFNNQSGLEFTDISSEIYREYRLDGKVVLRIECPLQLHVSKNGHRVFDSTGKSYYVNLPKDQMWTIVWEVAAGQPNFVK